MRRDGGRTGWRDVSRTGRWWLPSRGRRKGGGLCRRHRRSVRRLGSRRRDQWGRLRLGRSVGPGAPGAGGFWWAPVRMSLRRAGEPRRPASPVVVAAVLVVAAVAAKGSLPPVFVCRPSPLGEVVERRARLWLLACRRLELVRPELAIGSDGVVPVAEAAEGEPAAVLAAVAGPAGKKAASAQCPVRRPRARGF